MRVRTHADLERTRSEIAWIADDDLDELESKSGIGAALLGFFTWGGGRLMAGDLKRGIGLILGLVGWISVAPVLPSVLGPLVYMMIGAGSAAWSYNGVRAVNRFVATRTDLALRAGPDPSAYRLLAAAAAFDPSLAGSVPALTFAPAPSGPHAALIDRLRKLAALRRASVINETELRDRKIDILGEAAAATPAALEDLLHALLPLRDEGVLTQDDFDFLKQVGG